MIIDQITWDIFVVWAGQIHGSTHYTQFINQIIEIYL